MQNSNINKLTIEQGTKIQATIYGTNIQILENTLKLHQTYSITNATVTTTPDQFCFLEQKYQLTISARSPVEAKKVDGLKDRSIKYNFTPLADLRQIKDPNPNIGLFPSHFYSHFQSTRYG